MAKTPGQIRLTPQLVARVAAYTGEYRPQASVKTPDEVYEAAADKIMAGRPPSGEVWVFAFGSLMWKPGPEFGERRPGVVRGWHRAFCLGWDRAYRGNPVNPGLMLSLDRGGQCRGIALQIKDDAPGLRANLVAILRREPPDPAWVNVQTADGSVIRAIAFVTSRKSTAYIGGLTDAEIADAQAKASGKFGSMAEYLHNTIEHLQSMGIHDRHLWKMQELVAERLEAGVGPAGTTT